MHGQRCTLQKRSMCRNISRKETGLVGPSPSDPTAASLEIRLQHLWKSDLALSPKSLLTNDVSATTKCAREVSAERSFASPGPPPVRAARLARVGKAFVSPPDPLARPKLLATS